MAKLPEHIARVISNTLKESDDPDTQTACVIVTRNASAIAASNGLPAGVEVTAERTTRPRKYVFVMHAERRAICRASKDGLSTERATMYLNWFPCSDCAQAIIEAGISRLVCDKVAYDERYLDPRYGFAEAMEMLREAGIRIDWSER